MSFHNPYNFVPTPPREGLPDGLADGAPPGHHRWHDDRWSGEIRVRMEVITPLLLTRERAAPPDDPGPAGHRHLEIALDADGRLDIAPTSLKGMLRASYEALTCSRFGVFDRRDVPGFRSVSDGAAELLPALVEARDRIVVLGGLEGMRAAATVELWGHDRQRTRRHTGIAHGDVVDAVITRGNHVWHVVSLHPGGTDPTPDPGCHAVRGRLHAPGPTISTKHSECVLVTEVLSSGLRQDDHRTLTGTAAEELVDGLADLVAHQRAVHCPAGGDELWAGGRRPWEYLGGEPGRTAWSRHLWDRADAPAGVPVPPWAGPDTVVPPPAGAVVTCWAETADVEAVRLKRTPQHARGAPVLRLRPVLISRLRHRHAPAALLHPSLHPAPDLDHLSAADRVFGWVGDGDGERPEPAAHRGALRIVAVGAPRHDDRTGDGVPVVADLEPLALPPLSSPKPGQGRFYLAQNPRRPGDAPGPLSPGTDRYGFFQPASQQLRGRKVYPHHRGLEGLSPQRLHDRFAYRPPFANGRGEPRRPLHDSQNATLHQWVSPGAVVTFTVQVRDLHALELGALLWLLDPHRCGREGTPGRHRFGGGRPLGFGSVELAVSSTHLYTGARMRDRISLLQPTVDADDAAELAAAFEEALPASAAPVLDALRRSFAGFPRNQPVHYPRNHPDAPVYSWFVDNEKPRTAADPLRRQALPALGDERRLQEFE